MTVAAAADDWIEAFPGLATLAPDIRNALRERCSLATLPAGTALFGPGKAPENLLLLIEGSVRVQQAGHLGRDVVLYRVGSGESCVLTTACLLGYEGYPVEGIAETDIRAVLVPRAIFEDLIARSPEFRRFVFATFSRRITDLFRVIEEIAFGRIEPRLARKLLALARPDGTVTATHQMLATELGTAREVVSRQLQVFQDRGIVRLARGTVGIEDKEALGRLARA